MQEVYSAYLVRQDRLCCALSQRRHGLTLFRGPMLRRASHAQHMHGHSERASAKAKEPDSRSKAAHSERPSPCDHDMRLAGLEAPCASKCQAWGGSLTENSQNCYSPYCHLASSSAHNIVQPLSAEQLLRKKPRFAHAISGPPREPQGLAERPWIILEQESGFLWREHGIPSHRSRNGTILGTDSTWAIHCMGTRYLQGIGLYRKHGPGTKLASATASRTPRQCILRPNWLLFVSAQHALSGSNSILAWLCKDFLLDLSRAMIAMRCSTLGPIYPPSFLACCMVHRYLRVRHGVVCLANIPNLPWHLSLSD